jgi:endonuclease/exonuclease/phosphatase family metal-dependent hydrolase
MHARYLLLAALLLAPVAVAADPPADQVKVMSYNIRFGTAKDGENHWDKRKELLVNTVKAFDPDLLGTQETLDFQRDYLKEQLKGYEAFAAGRDDGKEKGEMAALFFRTERFEKTDGGHFWLSKSPDEAGSKGWDAALPRVVTWVKLTDKKAKGKPVLFMNTHFDHMGKEARLESAKLIRERLVKLGEGCSVILTGDFNSGEGSDPYKALFDAKEKEKSPVADSYRAAVPKRAADEGTATAFKAGANKGARIDWIGVSADWKVAAAAIDRTEKDGRTPSDHFAVTATLSR